MKKGESHTKTKLQPLADRVLIQEISEEEKTKKTDSGIYIPETVNEDKGAKKGKVLAVGEGRYEDGTLIPVPVQVGATVLFQWGDKITIDGEEYYIVSAGQIIAIVK